MKVSAPVLYIELEESEAGTTASRAFMKAITSGDPL